MFKIRPVKLTSFHDTFIRCLSFREFFFFCVLCKKKKKKDSHKPITVIETSTLLIDIFLLKMFTKKFTKFL